jgi:hypothetical protein
VTIAKAKRADKQYCRARNTAALRRWRAKHRAAFNAYQREYQKALSGAQTTAKPPELLEEETGGFALAPQTRSMRKGNIVGAVEPEWQNGSGHPVRPRNYTPALRGLSTNWVDGSQSLEGTVRYFEPGVTQPSSAAA